MKEKKRASIPENNNRSAGVILTEFIISKSKLIEKIFALLFIISAVCFPLVEINYDLSKYLPDDMPSKKGIDLMEQEFGYPGTARVMITEVSIYEAKLYKDKIEQMKGVDRVQWTDAQVDVYQANLFLKQENLEDYYKDGNAIMDITFSGKSSDSLTSEAITKVQELLGEKGHFGGPAVQDKFLNEVIMKEMMFIMAFAVILILGILTAATNSWFEPILFLVVILISIVINMGSNLILGSISSMTLSVAAVLQLAIAMDYTIILLDNFSKERAQGHQAEEALAVAIRKSIVPIASAGAAAIIGFLALVLMRYSIGKDMGLVLAKGIAISLVTVVFLTPAFLLRWYQLIEKTAHRPFVPSFIPFARNIRRYRYLILVIVLVLAVPSFVAKDMTDFTFGNDAMGLSRGTVVYEDEEAMNREFGRSNLVLAIVPNISLVTERALTEELEELEYINYATSLSTLAPIGVPVDFLPENMTELLHTKEYARIILSLKTATESELAFGSVDEISKIVKTYYPENSYIIGVTPSTQDIKSVIVDDWERIDKLSLLGVALAIMVAFRSLALPVVLMIPIQAATFVNMAIPYLMGDRIMFMGYVIVSCLQLGATIDYSIVMTDHYLEQRKTKDKVEASVAAAAASALPILTSGVILTAAGYGVYLFSSVTAIADLGRLIGRGAILSMAMVLVLLPNLLVWADGLILRKKGAAVMAAVIALSGVLSTAVVSYGAAPSVAMDESVYVQLDYYGTLTDLSVVKGCDLNGNSSFTDFGAYQSVSNMSGYETPEITAGGVTWNFTDQKAPKRFYYEGKLKQVPQLPWTIDISYKRNGVPVRAEELAGTSGLVEIEIKAKPNQKAAAYFRNNMLLQAVAYVDLEEVYSLEAPGSQLQSVGSKKAVVFSALPGEEADFVIRIGTDHFESDGIALMMMPGTLEQLKKIKDLKEAKDTLEESGDAVFFATNELLSTMESMNSGLADLKRGTEGMEEARSTLHAGKDQLNENYDQVIKDLTAVNEQFGNLIPQFGTGQRMIRSINNDIQDINETLQDYRDSTGDLDGSITTVQKDLSALGGMLTTLNGQMGTMLTELGTLAASGLATPYEAASLQGQANMASTLGNYMGQISSLLTETIKMGTTAKEILETTDDLMDDMDDAADTMERYEDDILDILDDMETLTALTNSSLSSTLVSLTYTKQLLNQTEEILDPAAEASLRGMTELLDKSMANMDDVRALKTANSKVKSTIDKQFDQFEEENNFLNLDAEAPLQSFTSEKNPVPTSLQIILRTQEISADDDTEAVGDLEQTTEHMGIMDRIAILFEEILMRIKNLF